MTNISSIHIQPTHIGEFFHNSREKETKNSIGDKAQNYCDRKAFEAIEIYKKDLEEKTKLYYEKHKRRLPKNTKTLFSAIVNLKEDSTIEDVKKVAKYLEEKLRVKIYQISIHEDEGHFEKDKFIKNRHAHIIFSGLDSNAQAIKRNKLNIHFLRQLQTDIANILKMERGKNRAIGERKRLNTYEYKKAQKITENIIKQKDKKIEMLKISKKELEKQISELRKEMININKQFEEHEKLFSKKDYQSLSEIKKQLKSKDLNINDIYELFKEFERTIKKRIKNKIIENIKNTTFLTKNKATKIIEENITTNKTTAYKFIDIVFKYKQLEKENEELKKKIKEKNEEILKKDKEIKEIIKTKNFYKRHVTELEAEIEELYKEHINKLEIEIQKLYKQIYKENKYKKTNKNIKEAQQEINKTPKNKKHNNIDIIEF